MFGSTASLSQSEISIHTRANSFHNMPLLLFSLKQQPASSRKLMRRKKGKQIWYIKKRKQTENGRTPGSEQPVVKRVCGSLLIRRRLASVITVCRWMTNFKLEGMKDQDRSTLHEHHIKIAQKRRAPDKLMEPDLRSHLRNNRER